MILLLRHRILLILLITLTHNHLTLQKNPSSRALIEFKNSLSNSDSLTNWQEQDDDDPSSPCDPRNVWVGIACNNNNNEDMVITSINLANMGLEGRPNLEPFTSLEHDLESITLNNNSLTGPIPDFNLLPSLKSIYASNNRFSGVIPPNYFQPFDSLQNLWLSNNKFSGPIPNSLGDLTNNLKELHLENNQFSGPIPRSLNKFDKKAFENNPDLCGPKASKECPVTNNNSQSTLVKKLIIAAVVVTLLLFVISMKDKRREENMKRMLSKQDITNEAVQVTIPSNNISRKSNISRKGYTSLNKRSSKKMKPKSGTVGEVVMVNEEKGVFSSQDLMKASAEVLGNGGLGSAYKATLENGVSVVVKRVKEMNQMSKDVFDKEMRKLGRLKHENILTPLAYHFRKEDKFLVSEYVPKGSLHNILHGDRGGIKHLELSWENRLKIIKGVARGMGYLHSEFASYELPHGNLKSCNVLIAQNYEPLLTDYALYPLINDTPTAQCMFAFRSPKALSTHHKQQVSHKSDVYGLGIIILEMVTGKYPSQYVMMNQKGTSESGTDVVQWVRSALDENREGELIDPELLQESKECVSQIKKVLYIGSACTESVVDERIEMRDAIARIEDV